MLSADKSIVEYAVLSLHQNCWELTKSTVMPYLLSGGSVFLHGQIRVFCQDQVSQHNTNWFFGWGLSNMCLVFCVFFCPIIQLCFMNTVEIWSRLCFLVTNRAWNSTFSVLFWWSWLLSNFSNIRCSPRHKSTDNQGIAVKFQESSSTFWRNQVLLRPS